jgi:hypothetical protein
VKIDFEGMDELNSVILSNGLQVCIDDCLEINKIDFVVKQILVDIKNPNPFNAKIFLECDWRYFNEYFETHMLCVLKRDEFAINDLAMW